MLRRKLLIMLGPPVALLVLTAVVAIWQLQLVWQRMDHISGEAWGMVEQVSALGNAISVIEVDLTKVQAGHQRRLDQIIDQVESLRNLVGQVGQRYITHEEGCEPCYQRLQAGLPQFERSVGALATAQDPDLANRHAQQAMAVAVELRQDILAISQYARNHAQVEQEDLASDFRNLVFGLAGVFLVVINVSVLMLLRAAGMILRPVDELTRASKQLASERFDYRVKLQQNDEFDELGQAYNHLAEQLQSNEQRKIEMLGQVALALNHELNNAMSVIGLQLQLLRKQAGENPTLESRLVQIQQSLERMVRTVQLLKQVRRVVLTDYVSGVKMLDLERSVEASAPPAAASLNR